LLFGIYLVIFSRVYGLYDTAQHQSGLHEQRMTVQATLTAGLLLCGTLYVMHGYALSRAIVSLTVLFTLLMQMARRGVWRKLRERRYLQGLETRNVLIVVWRTLCAITLKHCGTWVFGSRVSYRSCRDGMI